MGTLYLVATPIGNLKDISIRALEVLRDVGLIATEDTRHTRVLLSHYQIQTPLTSYYEHNKLTKLDYLLSSLEQKDVALVSEAGMPGISDPGYELVKAAVGAGITVVPIPGASAVIAALAVSGLPTDEFLFVGFLPRKTGERRERLRSLAKEKRTIVLLEAPHRIIESLEEMLTQMGDRQVAVARELTKIHEEVLRGSIQDMLAHFQSQPPRGEFTLVIAGASTEEQSVSESEVDDRLRTLAKSGAHGKDAVDAVAKVTGWPRKEIYKRWIALQKND
jgi:16S rRNA (cytidine1402-2'-O)-methyltransferase